MAKLNFLNDFMQTQLLRIIFIYIGIYGNATSSIKVDIS